MTKLPTINFKGKEYTLISERVKFFNETFENGSIITELVSPHDADRVIVKATVSPNVKENPDQVFTGYSQAKWSDVNSFVNKTSALENAETSAVGRALALMGIGVTDSIASMDEINKTTYTVNKIKNNETFTADDYEHAITHAPNEAFGAAREAGKSWKELNPPVKRNPGVVYGKKATGDRLREAGVPIVNQDDEL